MNESLEILEKCPFCGGEPELCRDTGKEAPLYFVLCRNCWASVDYYIRPQDAIAAWNRRF